MKYLKSKKDSIEESILQVWEKAAKLAEVGLDGRTKEYRNHRSRLERAREKRESLRTEDNTLDEKKAKYLVLEFKDSTTAANAYKHINNKIEPGGNQPWDDFNQEGKSLQFDNMKDADSLMKELKKKFKFKVYEREMNEASGGKEAYQKFFNKVLKKFGINSHAELKSDEEKKKFYDYIDKNWTADHEESVKKENYDVGTPENTKSKLKATPGQSADEWEEQVETIQKKNASMRERLAQIWSMDEGDNPFAPQKKKEEKTPKKTMTGEPVTKVKVDPKIDDR